MLVSKKHRTLGPALMVLKALVKGCGELGYQTLLAMPNVKSQPVFKRVGYKKAGTAYRWSKVLRSEDKIRHFIKYDIVRKTAAAFIDMALKFASAEFWIKFRQFKLLRDSTEKDVALEQVVFPESPMAKNILEKSPEYLKWRYAGICPGNPELFALYSEDQLLGYVIYTLNRKEVIVQEFFLPDSKPGIHVLLSRFVEKMRRQGHSTISVLHYGPEHFEKLLKQHGFVKREGRDVFAIVLNSVTSDFLGVLSKISWFEGDLDL
jgi:hypothetical protein